MKNEILKRLIEIEMAHDVKILYACESGSRAWGFDSRDSDYDVRFFYVHNQDWYLSIGEKRDVIENVGKVLDFSGWELRKMLRLYRSSNSSIFEKLQSPVVYKEVDGFRNELWNMASDYHKPISCIHSYLNLASSFYKEELCKEEVKLKKYFYVLRSILAAKWIMVKSEVPPMEFAKLRKLESGKIWNNVVDKLLYDKINGDESLTVSKSNVLNSFVLNEVEQLEVYAKNLKAKTKASTKQLDEFFRKWI
jgi:uncharacterized protein